jgi:hypothetical protein
MRRSGMSRPYLAFLLVPALWAQTQANVFEKAPPEVDEALRQRITGFYQDHVDGKFRQAEKYVAEDTKDFYYEANKPTYLSFKLDKITYSDNFTRAKAVVICKTRFRIPGFEDKPLDAPIPSTWRVENGQWVWYVDQSAGRETPFGRMKPPGSAPAAQSIPSMAGAPTIESLWKSVQADKKIVRLKVSEASSDEVTISSTMPGVATLRIETHQVGGFQVKMDRTELKPGEQAKLSFSWDAGNHPIPQPFHVEVVVEPINLVIPIEVHIQ